MNKGIAVAGNIAVDLLKKIDVYPEHSKLTTIREVSRSLGGAVCNCLIDLAKMDFKLPLKALGMTGADENGEFVIKTMGQFSNIDLSGVVRQGQSAFTDVMADESNKTRTFFFYRGISSQFSDQYIDLDNLQADILHIGYILLLDGLDAKDDDYGTVMARILCKAKERGIQTSIDVVSEESERYSKLVPPSLKYTDYCILNEIEASKTVGISLRDKDGQLITQNIPQVLKKLRNMGVTRWIIIHTPEASFAIDENDHYHVRPSLLLPEGFIKGTVGAGDAFVAGVLYSAYKGYPMERGMEIGTAAAACSLSEMDSTTGMKSIDNVMQLYNVMPKQHML
jgi:sugar/nucleoside kinase (ribokinase family)